MIECEDLSKNFDSFKAVDGISLRVKPGEILALLGQNGAGKTTTVRMLNSVLTPTRGWARVAGFDTVNDPVNVRSSVGVLTEMHGLYGRMTGFEYLEFFGKVYNLDKTRREQRSRELLEYFGMASDGFRRTGEYSKGMRQKISLARALIHDPPVLLLDEPTSAMDPESAQLVRQEIGRLRSSQRSIIICTHNLLEAELLADQIAIMFHGRILLKGSLEELRDQLLGSPVYEISLAGTFRLEDLKFPPGSSLQEFHEKSFRYQVSDPASINPIILQQLFNLGIPVISVQEIPRSLEKIYLEAMRLAGQGLL